MRQCCCKPCLCTTFSAILKALRHVGSVQVQSCFHGDKALTWDTRQHETSVPLWPLRHPPNHRLTVVNAPLSPAAKGGDADLVVLLSSVVFPTNESRDGWVSQTNAHVTYIIFKGLFLPGGDTSRLPPGVAPPLESKFFIQPLHQFNRLWLKSHNLLQWRHAARPTVSLHFIPKSGPEDIKTQRL